MLRVHGIEGEWASYYHAYTRMLTSRYVVQGVSLPMLMPNAETPKGQYPKAEPSVLIGIFPSSAVYVRPNSGTESEVLAVAYDRARELAEDRARDIMRQQMSAVREEDEEGEEGAGGLETEDEEPGSPTVNGRANGESNRLKRDHRPTSLILAHQTREKEQPPLPTLTAGDSTVAGQQWPLIDEIACAIREWYSVSRMSSR